MRVPVAGATTQVLEIPWATGAIRAFAEPAEPDVELRPSSGDALHRSDRLSRQQPSGIDYPGIQVETDESGRVVHRTLSSQ